MKLPDSWIEQQLSSLLDTIEIGGRPVGGVGEITSGIPSISGEHFAWDGRFKFESLKYIPEKYFETLTTGKLKIEDVLIVKDGATTAKCAYVDENFPFKTAAINEHVFLIRTNKKLLNSRYAYELLRSEFGRIQILKNYRGAAIGGITRSFANHLKLPLPTLPEQERIVALLRQADALVNSKKNIAAKLDTLIQTLYWEYFGKWYSKNGLVDPVRISEYIEDSQYGLSESMGEVRSGSTNLNSEISETLAF